MARVRDENLTTAEPFISKIVWFLLFIQIASNLFWLKLDTLPLIWDAGSYYAISLTQLQQFREIGPLSYLFGPFFTSQFPPYHPPLLYSLPLYAYLPLGPTQDIAVFFTSTLSYLGIITVTYLLGKHLYGERVANGAAVITTFLSPLYGLSRTFLMDLPCLALSILAVYALLRSSHFQKRSWSCLFVFSLSVGLWIKEFTIIYTLLPIALVSLSALRQRALQRRALIYLIAAALMASIPYFFHFDDRVAHYLNEQFSKPGIYKNPYGLTQEAFTYYLYAFERYHASVLTWIFGALYLLFLFFRPTDFTGYWILSIYVILSLIGIKTDRFLIGFLPALAIAAAYVLNTSGKIGKTGYTLLTILLAIQFFALSYFSGTVRGLETFLPTQEQESTHKIIRSLFPLQSLTDGSRRPLANFTHSESVCRALIQRTARSNKHLIIYNLSGYSYYTSRIQSCLAEHKKQSWVTTPAYSTLQTLQKDADFVIVKSGPFRIAPWEQQSISKARKEFVKIQHQFISIYSVKDIDGGKTTIYERIK